MIPAEIYTIFTFKSENESIEATVVFNENHPIFSGHFPGNPIVPGVVQIQIIKDLLEKITEQNLLLIQAKNIKFLKIISPASNPNVEVTVHFSINEEHQFPAQATIRSGDSIFMKFSGIYKPSSENK